MATESFRTELYLIGSQVYRPQFSVESSEFPAFDFSLSALNFRVSTGHCASDQHPCRPDDAKPRQPIAPARIERQVVAEAVVGAEHPALVRLHPRRVPAVRVHDNRITIVG